MNPPPQRVSAVSSPEEYVLPGRPDGAGDAFRQTQFLLSADLDLFGRAMNLQLRLAKEAYPSRFRTHELAALMGLWSRTYAYLGDAMLLLTRGSYISTLPLVRAACECIAAQDGLRGGEMAEHHAWLRETLKPNERFKAFEFSLGLYFAGSVIASDALLRSIYRPAADLARPNFGATLLQVGPESNNLRLALSFGDASFHLGWAEIVGGWLLALGLRQTESVRRAEGIFPLSAESALACEALAADVTKALARDDRCRIEEVMDGNDRRYLVHNFRRSAGAAMRKIVL